MKYAKWMLALTLSTLPILAAAQIGNNGTILANVPFEFTVANHQVPAGQWLVRSDAMLPSPLIIENIRAKLSLFVPASPTSNKTAANNYALVFHKYGRQYFLVEIRQAGSTRGYQLRESKAEAELRAQNVPASEETLLALLQ